MQRLLVLLLALCLPLSAMAETIAERIGAPERWQGEFQTSTGRTHVYVDMTIHIPAVEAVPLWSVEPRVFSLDEVALAADLYFGEGRWKQVDSSRGDPGEGELRYEDWGTESAWYSCHVKATDGDRGQVWTSYSEREGFPGVPDYTADSVLECQDSRYDRGKNVGTLEEAVALADAFIHPLEPDAVYESVDPRMDGYMMRMDRRGQSNYGYRLYYARQVGGMLITPVNQRGARKEPGDDTYTYVLPYESLYVDVGEGGVFEMRWDNPLEVKDMIAEDCELLPFETIMDILGTIAPLSIQHAEYEANNALYIDRAVLGYMCLQERGKPTSYRLVPVWDFFGARTIGRERYDTHNSSLLTINAIDGTIIDRELGY